MGNCYGVQPEYQNEDLKKFKDLQEKNNQIENEIPPVKLDELSVNEEENMSLIELLTEERIQEMIRECNERGDNFDVKKKNRVKNKPLKTLKTPFEFFFKKDVEKDENDKKQHIFNMLFKIKSVMTPAANVMYEMNATEESVQKIDGDISKFDMLRHEMGSDGNTVLQVVKIKTKKIAIIEGKDFLTVVVFRRTEEGNFWIVNESVMRNNLNSLSSMSKLRDEMKNECEIIIRGVRVGPVNGENGSMIVNRGNFNTSVGAMILKPVLGKKFPKFYNKQLIEKINFFLSEPDLTQVKWFTDSNEEKRKVFDAQRIALLQVLEENSESLKEEWIESLNALNTKFNYKKVEKTPEVEEPKSDSDKKSDSSDKKSEKKEDEPTPEVVKPEEKKPEEVTPEELEKEKSEKSISKKSSEKAPSLKSESKKSSEKSKSKKTSEKASSKKSESNKSISKKSSEKSLSKKASSKKSSEKSKSKSVKSKDSKKSKKSSRKDSIDVDNENKSQRTKSVGSKKSSD